MTNVFKNASFANSEKVLISILDNSPDPIFVKDEQHRWVYMNKKCCEIVGLSEKEIVGKSDYDFFPKEQANIFWEKDEMVFAHGKENENIEQLTDPKGLVRTIATKKTLLHDTEGNKLLVGTIRDITEISQLRKHEQQISNVLKELALGGTLEHVLKMILVIAEEEFPGMIASILLVDKEGKRLRSVAGSRLPAFFLKAIDGTPVKDAMGSCGTAAFRGETIVVEDVQIHPFWQGVKKLTEKAGLSACWSEPIIATNGNVVGTFALYYSKPKRPSQQELKLMQTMAQVAAITIENQRSKNEGLMLRKLLENIIDSMPSVLIGVDSKTRITQWNLQAEKKTGISRTSAIGQPLETVYPPMASDLDELHEAIQSQKIAANLKKVRHLASEDVYENITIYPLHASGMEGAVIRIDDITERVRLEETMIHSDKMNSIGVLAGGIAHDFNNLLVGILGNLNLASVLIEEDHKAYSLIKKAEKASLRTQDLTSQLLTFSKGGDPVRKSAALESVLTESSMFVLTGSNITCDFSIPPDLWRVDIDAGQISQVVQNLIINAKQATAGGGFIEVTCININRKRDHLPQILKGNKYVQVTISDTGHGVPEEHLGKIFDPYFSTKKEGSGLGLAVCHSIIAKHEGLITAKSKVGKGTSFSFYLPVAEDASTETVVVPSSPINVSGKILIMDDDKNVCEVASSMLTHLGFDVVIACNGEEAIQMYTDLQKTASPVDLIIMDLTIPGGMGGQEAAKKILAIYSEAKIIVSSGYSNDPVIANHRDYGFAAALKKPYKISEVSEIVSFLLS
ncbi:MAG: PAS domain S-box protein [Desulfobulbaceae bacterium]|nr:PAS domain S-box protein [Desulfobulbaceae bacterium]